MTLSYLMFPVARFVTFSNYASRLLYQKALRA